MCVFRRSPAFCVVLIIPTVVDGASHRVPVWVMRLPMMIAEFEAILRPLPISAPPAAHAERHKSKHEAEETEQSPKKQFLTILNIPTMGHDRRIVAL